MKRQEGHNQPPRRGLSKLWERLFNKRQPEADEDDFRPLASSAPRSSAAGVQGAHAPSRSAMAAAAAANIAPGENPPLEQGAENPTEAPAASRERPENRVLIRGSKLYELYCRCNSSIPYAKKGASYNLSLLMPHNASPSAAERAILLAIEQDARTLPQYAAPKKPSPENPEPPPALPVDAFAYVRLSPDNMTAYLFLLPSLYSGQPLPAEWIHRLLEERGVEFGIDWEAIETACQKEQYLQLIPIARGINPQHGENGEIVDYFSRQIEVQLRIQDDNTVDFKDLGWLQTVREGEIICDILKPTDGMPGLTVQGKQVDPIPGRPVSAPVGQGTHVNEEGTALLASMDGVLTFMNEGFRVDPLLIVKGDVDNGIGNLDVVGDILIYGDVREGFTIAASGNITVQGMVESAFIKAGGDVRISLGMNGSQNGNIEAGGDVVCQFLENATVFSGGSVVCDSLIHCNVHANKNIRAIGSRGVIIGGEVRALQNIEARTIGNEKGRMLTVFLGTATSLLEEIQQSEEKQQMLMEEIHDKEKNIAYLAPMEEALSFEEQERLDDLRQGLKILQMQLKNTRRRAEILSRKQQDYSHCYLKAELLHPPMHLIIGDIAAELRQPLTHVLIRRADDDILVESTQK